MRGKYVFQPESGIFLCLWVFGLDTLHACDFGLLEYLQAYNPVVQPQIINLVHIFVGREIYLIWTRLLQSLENTLGLPSSLSRILLPIALGVLLFLLYHPL